MGEPRSGLRMQESVDELDALRRDIVALGRRTDDVEAARRAALRVLVVLSPGGR